MIVSEALQRGATVLAEAGIDGARREARLLLRHAMGLARHALPDPAAPVDADCFLRLLSRRAAREPMAFILGRQGFWTLELAVSPDTLIPRADTETLVEAALAAFPDRARVGRILDLGTGTGALLLAALSEFPAAVGVGVDVSPLSVALAARNARANGLADRALLLCGNWAAALNGQFDLVLSNPPYIRSDAIAGLMPEVGEHEPVRALDGGPDGLSAYRVIIAALPRLLAPGASAVLELGAGQAGAVAALAEPFGWGAPHLTCDLSGIARALVLTRARS